MSDVGGDILYRWAESPRYALVSLPSNEMLVGWAEQWIRFMDTRTVSFENALSTFMMRYSQHSGQLPLVCQIWHQEPCISLTAKQHDVVRCVHKLNCLGLIRTGLILCSDDVGGQAIASCAVHTQVSFVSKLASQPVEAEILAILDKLLFSSGGIGPSNHLALWTCLWSLILMYRRLVRSYKAFLQFPCHVPEGYAGMLDLTRSSL